MYTSYFKIFFKDVRILKREREIVQVREREKILKQIPDRAHSPKRRAPFQDHDLS